MCKLFHYCHFFTAICSVLNLTAISLGNIWLFLLKAIIFINYFILIKTERYLAIIHPLKAKYTCSRKRAKIIVAFIWIISSLGAIPLIIGKVIYNYSLLF